MNNLQIFNNEQFGAIRVVMKNGEPWFVAKDVCRILDIANTTQALERLDDDERSMFNIGRQGDTNIVNEPGLYNLIFGSRKPEARQFKRWVTHEVLPTIRKTGKYAIPQTQNINNIIQEKINLINAMSNRQFDKTDIASLYRAAYLETMQETGHDYSYTIDALTRIEKNHVQQTVDENIIRFFDLFCIFKSGRHIANTMLHINYLSWCRQNEIAPLMQAKDMADIICRAYPKLKQGKQGFYNGIWGIEWKYI